MREIGRGSFAVVYGARQVSLNRIVAVKVLHGTGVASPMTLQRFRLEATALARFDHPNVVAVFDAGECSGVPYVVMEYHSGGSLAQRLAPGPLEARAAARLAEGVARGVGYCHTRGILHRDLKPGNILLAADGTPKVADFGLAKWLEAADGPSGSHDLLGTPCYMAPEQAAGAGTTPGPATDVYGIGAVLYCMLTGRPPFVAPTIPQTLALVQSADPLPPAQLAPGVPRGLEAICLKALSRNSARRYPTADALADDLRHWLDGRPIVARPPGAVERGAKWVRRHPGRAVAVALAVALAGGLFYADEVSHRRQREARTAAQVQALATADTAAVPQLIEAISTDRDLARAGLRQLAGQPVTAKAGLHARMALLAEEPERADELASYLPACRPDELVPVREALRPAAARVAPPLWAALSDPGTPVGGRVRAAGALAGLAPDDGRWAAVTDALVAGLVRETPLDAATWGRALEPVRDRLLPALTATYTDALVRVESGQLAPVDLAREVTVLETTAGLLARYAADRPDALAGLAVAVAPQHHRLLEPGLREHRREVIARLRAELARVPGSDRYDVVDALAKRQAHAAAAVLSLGDDEAWHYLRHSPDPSRRSYLVARLAGIGLPASKLIVRFREEADASARRALILALGDRDPGPEPAADREAFVRELLLLYRDHPDPGLHGAIDWLLRVRWGQAAELAALEAALPVGPPAARAQGWFVNRQGMTLAVVRPVEFVMGSPRTELGWSEEEKAHCKRIPRSFAIGTKEVSVRQYQAFRRATGNEMKWPADRLDTPVGVSWYDAARYCNWLSEQAGLPEDQWCYAPNGRGEYGDGMSIKASHLALRGYRLPTEAEWECACRADARTARYYGGSDALLPRYGWHLTNAGDQPRPVGLLRPNDLGLFDTLGNAWEWCEHRIDFKPEQQPVDDLTGPEVISDRALRRLKGGAFHVVPVRLRAALKNHTQPTNNWTSCGFRVVCTLP